MGNDCNKCSDYFINNTPKYEQDLSKDNKISETIDKMNAFNSNFSIKNYDFQKDYTIIKKLGKGSYATVYLIQNKQNNIKRSMKAIKKINLIKDSKNKLLEEIVILKNLDHPNIAKLYDVYEDEKFYYLIIEYCKGGELFEAIKRENHFNEWYASKIMFQIFSSINYCHKKGIIHRDIKPENLIFSENNKDSLIKLIDFGVSVKYEKGKKYNEINGTIYYISPEVFKNKYDKNCDIWSCGIIMYILLCGYPPFNGDTDEIIKKNILNGTLKFYEEDWNNISDSAKDLITKLLNKDPNKRIAMKDIFKHEWIDNNNYKQKIDKNFFKNINNFQVQSKLKYFIINYIANQINFKDEKDDLIKIFKNMDSNNDGVLTKNEFIEGFKINNKLLSENEIKEKVDNIFSIIDINNNGKIDFSEFVSIYIYQSKEINKKLLKKFFKSIDTDNSGFIEKNEFSKLMGDKLINDEEWKNLIEIIDEDNDGKINFEEFCKLLKNEIK